MKSDKDEVKNCDIEFIPGNSINIYENHATRFKNAREWSAKKSLIMDIFLSSKCITIVISSLNLRRQNACELVVYVQDCYTYTIFFFWLNFVHKNVIFGNKSSCQNIFQRNKSHAVLNPDRITIEIYLGFI